MNGPVAQIGKIKTRQDDEATRLEKIAFCKALGVLFKAASQNSCARVGNLSSFMYGEPEYEGDQVQGANIYNELLKNPDYYHYFEGLQIKSDEAQAFIPAFVTANNSAQVIDLGPGPRNSVLNKAIPFLKPLKNAGLLIGYTAVDNNRLYLDDARDEVSRAFPGLLVSTMHLDFERLAEAETNPFEEHRNPVFLLLGNIFGNFASCDEKGRAFDENYFNPLAIKFLENVFDITSKKGGKLVVGIDCNQDETTRQAAYDNDVTRKWVKNLLHRMERDGGVEFSNGLDLENFDVFSRYNHKTSCQEIGLTLKSDQSISFEGTKFSFSKGTEWHIWNSNKFPPDLAEEMLKSVGFKIYKRSLDNKVQKEDGRFNDGVPRTALIYATAPKIRANGGGGPNYVGRRISDTSKPDFGPIRSAASTQLRSQTAAKRGNRRGASSVSALRLATRAM